MKQNLLLFFIAVLASASPAFAQTINVKGTITDSGNLPVIGASVIDTGKRSNGTITDLDGNFIIDTDANATLEISCIGYRSISVGVDGRSSIAVTLEDDSEFIDEVVVVGYGTIRKKDLTGAISSLGDDQIKDTPVANIGQALQGKVAGVHIVDNGAPGENVSMKIRGLGTINDSDPLVVLDGVPTDLGLSAINTADIERIDVLKDASATAIYGSRGANGVVMITTKKGSSGKATLSITANCALQDIAYVPEMLNAAEYAELSNEMLYAAGIVTNPQWSVPEILGQGTDWVDQMIQKGIMQNYTVSCSGGNDKHNYYISGGFLKQKGIIRNVDYNRFTFQANTSADVLKWLKLTSNITFSTDRKHSGSYSMGEAMNALPTQALKDEDGSWSGPDGKAEWYGSTRNPIGTIYTNSNDTDGYNILANISAQITFTKWLKFKSTFGYDAKIWFNKSFSEAYPYKPTPVEEATRYEASNKAFTYLWDNYLTFDHTFARKHYVNVMAGTSAQWNNTSNFNATKAGFFFDSVNQMDNGMKEKAVGGSASNWSLFSVMARANYTYDDRFLATFTFRCDGSSHFAPSHRWGNFPSISAAWRLSKEPWWKDSSVVNDLKIRAGYGITGNEKIGSYSFLSSYNTGVYIFGDTMVPTLSAVTMANPDIHWEEVRQSNIGLDMSLIGSRISLSVDGYIKNTVDMLVKAAIPITTGYEDTSTTYKNAGTVRNSGIEINLNTVNIETESVDGFRWETNANLTWNRNWIVSLNNDTPLYQNEKNGAYITIQKDGFPINSFYGYVTDGLFQTQDEVEIHAFQEESTAAGDIRFKDLNSDGVINEKDRTIIGNPNPEWIYSMSNTMSYKGFELSFQLQGAAGYEIFNANDITNEGMSAAYNQTKSVIYRWKGYGTSTFMPRAIYGDPNHNTRISDRFIEDGSYLRLKNITLGYTFPSEWMKRIHLQSARILLSCENVVTLTRYSGFDPEVGINGIDNSRYPIPRTYSIGLNIQF
ncbi:MAG: TonB-dependent receptor [Bacteroidales bacterium]|nr:TonB-dependent receptor [Bacteroidales bacterium]